MAARTVEGLDWGLDADGHGPDLVWECLKGCGAWPCAPAKVCLAEGMTEQRLLHVLHQAYGRWVQERPTSDRRDAYRRFVKWAK